MVKIDRNFACFWPPNFFREALPEFLEWDYKIRPDSDHVAKFQGDRSRDLGERVAKKEKLEVHGRARREAARRRNTELTVNLAIRNCSPNNATCQMTPKTVL